MEVKEFVFILQSFEGSTVSVNIGKISQKKTTPGSRQPVSDLGERHAMSAAFRFRDGWAKNAQLFVRMRAWCKILLFYDSSKNENNHKGGCARKVKAGQKLGLNIRCCVFANDE